ncbi:MAG: family 43 glycosylhydrolase [Fibrobacter sp.]|nr:family 43 glycosylhydrolase [Fibrobacter sp.]
MAVIGKRGGLRFALVAIAIAGLALTAQAKWLTIHNDFNQYDTDGNLVRTRSGCLNKFGETYYWYGCDQYMTNQTCYSSTDLLHWKNHGNMLTATRGTNRMDVLYNDSTKMYVMVLKWETEGTDNWCKLGIATSSSPTGPFTKQSESLVYGAYTGDMSVFKDDDGKAYYCFESWDNGATAQHFSLMTWDYMGLEKKIQTWNNRDREANLIMKRRGIYYYMTSGMMGIDPTETRYWTARNINGPWTTNLVSVIAPGDMDRKSWDTQCDFVFPFKGTQDTVQMYCGDRWKVIHPERSGGYVWLPITFTPKDSVVLNYYMDWEVDPEKGIWRTIEDSRNLALNKTATASSTSGSNIAGNVTNPATYRNYHTTKWVSGAGDAQWISVDLGTAMDVNRVILKWDSLYAKSFKIQVSTDNTAWTDVFSTTKGGARSVTDETFETVSARYVRMSASERGSTNGGYGLFDFMVLNDSLPVTDISEQHTALPAGRSPLVRRGAALRYAVACSGPVEMDLIDCRGRLASVLVKGFKNAGVYEVPLPGGMSKGIYIARFKQQSGAVSSVRVRL